MRCHGPIHVMYSVYCIASDSICYLLYVSRQVKLIRVR